MAETLQNSSTESMPKNCSCFTACFGSSNKILSKDMKAAPPANTSKNNKTTSLTFWSRCCANKSSVEIIHVEAPVSEKSHRSSKEFTYSAAKLNKKIIQQKNDKQTAGIMKICLPAAAPGHHNSKVHNHKKDDSEIDKQVLSEKNSKFHQSVLLVKDTNQKKEKKRSRSSSFGAQHVENTVVATNPAKVLPHSISLPPLNRNKEATIRGGNDIEKSREAQGKLDPIIGMSIMMGTLAIMLIWGRVCAIVCTCAWLYMVPRLRTIVVSKGSDSGGLDVESVEYKKKVVLEGLLKRDRRRVLGNL